MSASTAEMPAKECTGTAVWTITGVTSLTGFVVSNGTAAVNRTITECDYQDVMVDANPSSGGVDWNLEEDEDTGKSWGDNFILDPLVSGSALVSVAVPYGGWTGAGEISGANGNLEAALHWAYNDGTTVYTNPEIHRPGATPTSCSGTTCTFHTEWVLAGPGPDF